MAVEDWDIILKIPIIEIELPTTLNIASRLFTIFKIKP
jgi:hypothetical protein